MENLPSPLLQLPEELIGKIYSQFSDPQNACSLLSVSKKSHEMAKKFCCSDVSHASITMYYDWEGYSYILEMDSDRTTFGSSNNLVNWADQVLRASKRLRSLRLNLHYNCGDDDTEQLNFVNRLFMSSSTPKILLGAIDLRLYHISRIPFLLLFDSLMVKYPNTSSLSVTFCRLASDPYGSWLCGEEGVLRKLAPLQNLNKLRITLCGGDPRSEESSIVQVLELDVENHLISMKNNDWFSSNCIHAALIRELCMETNLLCREYRENVGPQSGALRILGESNMNELTIEVAYEFQSGRNGGPLEHLFKVVQSSLVTGLESFFEARENNEQQRLTVNIQMQDLEISADDLYEFSFQAYNRKEIDFGALGESLKADLCSFIPQISMHEFNEGNGKVVTNFWTLRKGQREVVVNLYITCLDEIEGHGYDSDYDYLPWMYE